MYAKKLLIFLFVYSIVTHYSENADMQWHQINEFVGYTYLKIRLPGDKEAEIISHFPKYEKF